MLFRSEFEQVATLDRCRYEFMKMCHLHDNFSFINGDADVGWVRGAIHQRLLQVVEIDLCDTLNPVRRVGVR